MNSSDRCRSIRRLQNETQSRLTALLGALMAPSRVRHEPIAPSTALHGQPTTSGAQIAKSEMPRDEQQRSVSQHS